MKVKVVMGERQRIIAHRKRCWQRLTELLAIRNRQSLNKIQRIEIDICRRDMKRANKYLEKKE